MLKPLIACALAALSLTILGPASPTLAQQQYPTAEEPRPARTRARVNDAYRPGPDQAGLGVLGGSGQAEPGQGYGSPQNYGNPSGGAPLPAPSYSGAPTYSPAPAPNYSQGPSYSQGYGTQPEPYSPPYQSQRGGAGGPVYGAPAYGSAEVYRPPVRGGNEGFGQPYSPPQAYDDEPQGRAPYRSGQQPPGEYRQGNTYSTDEIKNAGHGFFGSISQGLASVIEHTYRKKGRPNGYILGEEAGGAFVAGLRYGQGRLYTKDAGVHNIYWQGPSLGFDAGAEGSKVMVLVYNMRDVGDIYDRFGGIDGSAYVVGGVGVTFLSKDHVVLAPIRSGVGLRLGANVGYLKYTSKPTWNPF